MHGNNEKEKILTRDKEYADDKKLMDSLFDELKVPIVTNKNNQQYIKQSNGSQNIYFENKQNSIPNYITDIENKNSTS